MYLFPFEKIAKNSRIVLYGAGNLGLEYVKQINKTGYCTIVGVVDVKYAEKDYFPLPVLPPDILTSLSDYDHIVLALASEQNNASAVRILREFGVGDDKILMATNRWIGEEKPDKVVFERDTDDDTLSVLILARAGLGDALPQSVLLKELRKLIAYPARIDFSANFADFFSGFPFISNVYKWSHRPGYNAYDVVLDWARVPIVLRCNQKKLDRLAPRLSEYCSNAMRINQQELRGALQPFLNDFMINMYALAHDKIFCEQGDIHELIPVTRKTPSYMDWKESAFDILKNLNLAPGGYIVVCNAVNYVFGITNPKLWPHEYFEKLIRLIKKAYPGMPIVQLGDSLTFGTLAGVDECLLGRTSADDSKVIVKYAALLVSVEGGLVHLRHALQGRSICLFGPTSPEIYGYSENINLRGELQKDCVGGCEWFLGAWKKGCLLREEFKNHCMTSLAPDFVFTELRRFLDARTSSSRRVTIGPANKGVHDLPRTLSMRLAQLEPGSHVAWFGREGFDAALREHGQAIRFTIYDTDFSLHDDPQAIDFQYGVSVKARGAEAEYGFHYNIPASDGVFQAVVATLPEEARHPEFVLRELARITAPGGWILLRVGSHIVEPESWDYSFAAIEAGDIVKEITENSYDFEVRIL